MHKVARALGKQTELNALLKANKGKNDKNLKEILSKYMKQILTLISIERNLGTYYDNIDLNNMKLNTTKEEIEKEVFEEIEKISKNS